MRLDEYYAGDIPRRDFLKTALKGGIAMAATPALMTSLL